MFELFFALIQIIGIIIYILTIFARKYVKKLEPRAFVFGDIAMLITFIHMIVFQGHTVVIVHLMWLIYNYITKLKRKNILWLAYEGFALGTLVGIASVTGKETKKINKCSDKKVVESHQKTQ